jgi:ATP-dependent RNA helicase HelY
LQKTVTQRTGSLARTFDRVCALLESRGYISADTVTDAGRVLARIWAESDLLVAECLRTGVWEPLTPAELAAAVSVLVYETRREGDERESVPRGPIGDAVETTMSMWAEVEADEAGRGLHLTRRPDLGFVWPMYHWANGESLAKALASAHTLEREMAAGDFVRWARQVIDLLGQIGEAAGPSGQVRATARQAITLINRGVLAATSLA